MKKGDIVNIYQQVLTGEKLEGEAELIEFIQDENSGPFRLERWKVRFLVDDENEHYERWIKNKGV